MNTAIKKSVDSKLLLREQLKCKTTELISKCSNIQLEELNINLSIQNAIDHQLFQEQQFKLINEMQFHVSSDVIEKIGYKEFQEITLNTKNYTQFIKEKQTIQNRQNDIQEMQANLNKHKISQQKEEIKRLELILNKAS